MAEYYNTACRLSGKPGRFVFLSAAPTIAPLLQLYLETKLQAEDFLLHNCPNLTPIILKPGLVWHESERSWSLPLKFANDIGYQFNKNVIKLIPGNEVV
jgi:hypothetical protein